MFNTFEAHVSTLSDEFYCMKANHTNKKFNSFIAVKMY